MTDADQFEAFVRRYQDQVFGIAVRLLDDPSEAEDVAQTVFLRAFERFDRIEDSPAAAGWLRTVATNLCLNHLSRHRRRWRLFSEVDADGPDEGGQAFADRLVAPEPFAAEREGPERQAQLERALRHTSGCPWCSSTSRSGPIATLRPCSACHWARSRPTSTAAAACCGGRSKTHESL